MSTSDLSGSTAIVTGASRGFGRAIAIALAASGVHVVGVARSGAALEEVQDQLGEGFTAVVADVADPDLAVDLISRYQPRMLVLNAGATPPAAVLAEQTWESFSTNWHTDVRHVFQFVSEALRRPLVAGSTVISFSSGAALRGSPMSGGYAGAKATIKFISAYAGLEAARGTLGIRFVSVLPQITPATDLGAPFVAAYAQYSGLSQEAFLAQFGDTLTPDLLAKSVVELAADRNYTAPAYLLTASGPRPLD